MNSAISAQRDARDQLIVALDVGSRAEALALVKQLRPFCAMAKIGLQLFTAEGPELVHAIRKEGVQVFLDLKFHDIPNTVARAVKSTAQLDVQILTVHLGGGSEMVRAAVATAPSGLLLAGVTVLTSSNAESLREIGISNDVAAQVLRLASLGVDAGLPALVCSGHEISALRQHFGPALKLIVPGIRQRSSNAGDQKRTMTPREAVNLGADYLVIGRPIIGQPDPARAAQRILEELAS